MKWIMILAMLMLLIPMAYADVIGNYNFQGTGGVGGCNNGVTDYVCQKHKFYKAGTIVNITLPIDVIAGQYQFFVSTSKDSLNVYQSTLQNITGDWQKTRALENNFTVTTNQELWFCMNYYSGVIEQYRCGYTDSGDSQELHHRYPLNQVSVGIDEFGIWYGSSFPLKSRANASTVPLASVGGGYIYSDGTGNLWGEQGIERAMSTQKRGEVFQFPDSNQQIINLTMFIESDCDAQNYVKYGLTHNPINGTDIVNCSWNCSANIGAFPELVTCDVSAQNKYITIGDYYIYAQCFTDETLSTPCPTTDINMPTSRTKDGSSVGKYHDWQSYGRNDSYFVNLAYDDTPFMLGYEPPTNFQCEDGVDNDGDGFIDYPDDPSCISSSDNTESPYDYVACNNGLDDDFDGFTDYPDDPSCDNATDTTEYPADASVQPDPTCDEAEFCLQFDDFSYLDDLTQHGWYGTDGLVTTTTIFGSNRVYLQDLGVTHYNLTKNNTNNNIYSDVVASWDMYFEKSVPADTGNYSFLVVFEDSDGQEALRMRYTMSGNIQIDHYLWNGTAYEWLATNFPGEDELSKTTVEISFDQTLKTFVYTFEDYTGAYTTLESDYDWTDVLTNKIHRIRIARIDTDSSVYEAYLDNILIEGELDGVSVCDDYDLPYYIVESFNGNPTECDWNNNLNVFFDGKYKFTNQTTNYVQFKEFDDVFSDDDARYLTVTFDAEFDTINTGGDTTIRLYDDEEFNFLTAFWFASPINWYYSDDGTTRIAQNPVPTNQTYSYKIIIDAQEDNYDLFFNGTEVVSDATFTDEFYNLKSAQHFKIQSRLSTIQFDNLKIYSSTIDGTPLVPDDELTPTIDEETLMCGYIYKAQPSCSDDTDCDSGRCMANNKCARFDANYCTEKGHEYGNWCFMSATASCGLTTMGNVILDNFLLFIIFLILLMVVVYFFIMSRN